MAKHIAIYTDDPDKGGVALYNHELAIGLVERGYRVTLVQAASDGETVRQQVAAGIAHEWIGYDTGTEFVRTITDVAGAERAFQACAPDLAIFSDCCAISNIAGKHVAIARATPFLTVVHNAAPYLAKQFAKCLPVMKGQFARARQVITVSSENLRLLRGLFGLAADHGVVIFPGTHARFFEDTLSGPREALRRQHGIADDAVVSLTSARLDPMKGFVLQVCALEALRAHFPKSRLVCVWAGDGPGRESFAGQIELKKLTPHVRMIGRQRNIHEWLDAADVFTLTSLTEGMPICIMEAMAKGRPVISTAVGGVAEELDGTGLLLADPNAAPKDVVLGLAQAWMELERNPDRRRKLGALGRQRALQHFRIETMIERTVAEIVRC